MGDFETDIFPSPEGFTDEEVDSEYEILPSPVGFTDEEVSSNDECDLEEVSSRGHPSANHALAKLSESMLSTDLTSANVKHTDTEMALDEEIWGSLPDELLLKILTWLPPVTLFRFRCVSVQWKTLFSSLEWLQLYAQVKHRSTSTIMCTLWEAHFFCHVEQKWFQIPLGSISNLENQWKLVDSDAGVLLYRRVSTWTTGVVLKFCVCNPLTGSSKVLPPYQIDRHSDSHFLKLLVDGRTQHFKLVVLVSVWDWWDEIIVDDSSTIVYDSSTSVWSVYNTFPSQPLHGEVFVRKNVIYAKSSAYNLRLHMAFDIDSRVWSEVQIDLPCHLNPSDTNIQVSRYSSGFFVGLGYDDRSPQRPQRFFVSNKGRLLLVQLDSKVEEPIAVWELLGDVLDCTSSASGSQWKKITISLPENLEKVLNDVTKCFLQTDCIVFSTSHSNKWITYTFRTKSWRVMPTRGRKITYYSWFEWESRMDIELESDPLYESHWPGLFSCPRTTHAWISKAVSKEGSVKRFDSTQ